ncbi:DNRLRE domain-containing protein [Viridibacillus sp. FSL R5-0477]|uniref:Wall-associated protein n=1 Tax=Viridibacillus arenosi FSL R5-213 TaxID=1227360 RepID=W4EY53_9BACL|nr:DNRLRE domain-containing protein [Viridibacillus arenosi]ETT85523.1 wall-associated protein [Viridibacillus arenosi FSL R5-213]OMC87015.1 hypothetical protein BK137_21335 [Viridibacillus arenosi]
MNIKKYIAQLLIFSMIVSLVPEYVGAALNENQQNSKEAQSSEQLEVTKEFDEVIKERSANSKTFTNGTGDFLKEVYPEEVHNKVNGQYQEISEELVYGQDGYMTPEETNLESMFPDKLSDDEPLIYRFGNHELAINITNASDGDNSIEPLENPNLEKENNNLYYKEIYPNIDLRHIALNNEVKEDWIVNEFTGINEFNYSIKTDLYGEVKADGSVGFYEDTTKSSLVFSLPKPVMVDSNYNETLGDGTRSTKIHYDLKLIEKGLYELKLTADKEWLASSKRVFPIYIDPSVSINVLGDTYVASAYPNANFNKQWDPSQGEYVLQTGYYDSTSGTNYPFMKFSIQGDFKGAVIDSAQLAAYVTHSYYATEKTGLWVDEVKSKWLADDLTWNNKPTSKKITSTTVARDQWAYFDVTDTVQAWTNGTRNNYGFKFHTNGNGKTYWKKITAGESTNKAKMVISYHYEKMANPTITATAYEDDLTAGYVNVKWPSVYGADSYELQMYDGKDFQSVYSGTATTWTAKGKKLFPKKPYAASNTYKEGKGVELPIDPSEYYSKRSGTTITDKKYSFRVLTKFPKGDSPVSNTVSKAIPSIQVGTPDLPKVTAHAYPESDTANKDRGWLDISWKAVPNATGYKVRIWNGTKYEDFEVGKITSVSTKGKKIWPTDKEIEAGKKDLHITDLSSPNSVGKGAELPIDPSNTYGNSSTRYSIRVIALSATGNSPSSDVNYGYIPLMAPKNIKVEGALIDTFNNKGNLKINWDAVTGAKYYQVEINNGSKFEKYQVKGKTNFDTTGITLFDKMETTEGEEKDKEINLPAYPSNYYKSAPLEKNKDAYEVRVSAYRFGDEGAPATEEDREDLGLRGLSDPSASAYGHIPLHEELNGIEDYFTYGSHSFGNAEASVNVTTGNMALQFNDESLFTRGTLGFGFTRTYNSRSQKDSPLGKGWSYTGGQYLTVTDNKDVQYFDEDGTLHLFKYDTDTQTYISPKGKYLKLEQQDADTFEIKDPDDFVEIYEKDSKDDNRYHILSYTDGNNNKIQFSYIDNQLKKIAEVNQKGEIIRNTIDIDYNTDNRIEKISYSSHWTEYHYDENGYLKSTTIKSKDTEEKIIEGFAYYKNGQMKLYIDGKKAETKFLFDDQELTVFDKQDTDAEISVSTTYHYDADNNVFKVTDTDGNETFYSIGTSKDKYLVTKIVNSDDTTSTIEYDDQFNIKKSTDADGNTTSAVYDPTSGKLTKETSTEGTSIYEYNSKNQLIHSADAKGVETTNTYKGVNLEASKVGEELTSYLYDDYGRIVKTTYANGTFEETAYNDTDDSETKTDAKNNVNTTQYNEFGQTKKLTDGTGRSKSYEYHPLHLNRISSVIDGKGNKTSYEYDGNGNLKKLTDAFKHVKQYQFNDNDQLEKIIFPGLSGLPDMIFDYVYNLNGNLDTEKKPSGINTKYEYNEVDEVDKITVKSNNGANLLYWDPEYENGLIKSSKFFNEQTNTDIVNKEFKYDDNGKLRKYTEGSFDSSYGYDEKERINKIKTEFKQDENTWDISQSTEYKVNEDKIHVIKVLSGEKILQSYKFDEDVADNKNSIMVNTNLFERINQFNKANLLTTIQYKQGDQVTNQFNYMYDQSGNITKEESNQGKSIYEYDANNQLTNETLPDGSTNIYDYDVVGNRKERKSGKQTDSFEYNEANQVKTKNGQAYSYDADGNLTQDENFKYEYNGLGQQVLVTDLADKEVARYNYDENGLRTKKIVGSKTYEYHYENENLAMEVVKNNGTISEYRYYQWDGTTPLGSSINTRESNGDRKEITYHYWTNQRGDVLSIRNDVGEEIGSYEYDAYGNILEVNSKVAKENPIRYAGYYYDEETSHYYLQARYYNPENGAFMALDPHPGDDNDPLTQNGYTYANNNPVIFIDYNGQKSFKKKVRSQINKAPKWVKDTLKKAFPNKTGFVYQNISFNAVKWGVVGGFTGEVIVSISMFGRVKKAKAYGTIGLYSGFLVGAHMGAITSAFPAYARYQIGVFLFGK